jgi:hypothetical protein
VRVAPEAREARFLTGEGATGLSFVAVTTDSGRALRWERAQIEIAHELGEDWWLELEEQFIGDDAIPGDVVQLDLQTRDLTYN